MSNMSYCRFTNTRGDLQDCLEALREETCLSNFEVRAGRNMFLDFLDFCRDHGIIDAYDANEVKGLFAGLQKQEAQDE